MDIAEARTRLQQQLDARTYAHSLSVSETMCRLAHVFGVEEDAARCAGLLHDCAKGLSPKTYLAEARAAGLQLFAAEVESPPVLHQRLGAVWAEDRFGVRDPSVLAAIACHTTGRAEMDDLARCLFVVDWISPDRTHEAVPALRRALDKGPEAGFLAVLAAKRRMVEERALPQHPWASEAIRRWLEG